MTAKAEIAQEQTRQYLKVHFKRGLPGFEQIRECTVKPYQDNSAFFWLEETEPDGKTFLTADPYVFFPDYSFELAEVDIQDLKASAEEDLLVLTTVTVPEDVTQSTVNLLGPIVINRKCHEGKQIILNDPKYSTKHRIFA